MLQICENIRLARKTKKISQEDVAEKLGTKRSTYQSWETNIEPDLNTIKRIAEVFGIPAYELLKGVIEFEPVAAVNETSRQKRDGEKEVFISFAEQDLPQIQESLTKLVQALNLHHQTEPAAIRRGYTDLPLGKKGKAEKKK